MPYTLGARSAANLVGVDPRMVRVVKRALLIAPDLGCPDFTVTCGVRTLAQQKALYAQGRTKPGKVVTWTLNSRHLPNPKTGLGEAVDLFPGTWDIVDNKKTPEVDDAYALLAKAMLKAAELEGVAIRWGANWDGDRMIREKGETDNPHFELAR